MLPYASDYLVETSVDGEEFSPLYSHTSWKGEKTAEGCLLDRYDIPVKTYGRYVRVIGKRRATAYGTSIRELEVYGDNDFSHSEVSMVGMEREVDVYNLQGILLRRGVNVSKATEGLHSGCYIVGSRKIVVR